LPTKAIPLISMRSPVHGARFSQQEKDSLTLSGMSDRARMYWLDSTTIHFIFQFVPKQPESHPKVLQKRRSLLAIMAETPNESSSRTAPKSCTF
jgi:hypothetical protein